MDPYLDQVTRGVTIFDGAMGTNLQLFHLGPDDFGGPQLEGCNENLTLTRSDVVAAVHASFCEVGCDVIETNTFGALAPVLAEYGIADRAFELNRSAAALAREVASSFDRRRFVAGSMGPGTKMTSLGQISFAELRNAYETQARGLLAGGVDLLVVETVYDLLSAKAAIIGARRAMGSEGRVVPLQVQITIETNGRMLPGTETPAALTSLIALKPDLIGLNCATGPSEMSEHLRFLSQECSVPISCLPNAGLPAVVDGAMHYDLTPEELADAHARFISEFGVQVVGGCCGTTPDHLRAVVERCRDLEFPRRTPLHKPAVSSLYTAVDLTQETSLLAIGERTNANGSKRFREAMLAGDWDTCVTMAREQVADGAHLIDICVDYTGENGVANMNELALRLATASSLPLMIDSTEPEVIEAALTHVGGRSILNSVNLEDGDGPGTRLDRFLSLSREYGAAVVATCIDQRGQARTPEWKLDAAQQIFEIATTRYGLAPEDLIFDPLVLPITTGLEESRKDGQATIEAIRLISEALPESSTIIGLSNISFGLAPPARRVLNSVFLAECHAAGLTMAIMHPSKILPLNKIPDDLAEICRDLIYDRWAQGDPLHRLIEAFQTAEELGEPKIDLATLSVEERLSRRIIDGNRTGLQDDLEEALNAGHQPLAIINDMLLPGMAEVGELFGSGKMQLPFVLASAETMKSAVAYLEPHMERSSMNNRGTIVLATVKGDVHDIGKNLVDIILTNNGYRVHNLGIKVTISEMIAKALEHSADVIGMSGLLVKSTLIMQENLVELNQRNLSNIPVILGGAALTRTFVERDLREVYDGRVFYGKDAFEGLSVLEKLGQIRSGALVDADFGRTLRESRAPRLNDSRGTKDRTHDSHERSLAVVQDNHIYEPPFLGTRVIKGIPLEEIAEYLNETALFRHQWGFRPAGGESDVEFKERIRHELRRQLDTALRGKVLDPRVVYGYFRAASDGNNLIIYSPETDRPLAQFNFPRQQEGERLCIADFVRPTTSRERDYVAFHIVTMGERATEVAHQFFTDNRYQDYLYLHGFSVEMTEALAELWHARIRRDWGFADEDGPTLAGLFKQKYRGGRYSWGYPACPDLEANKTVVELLGAESIGVSISDSFQLHPEQSTSAIILHHPQAKYFIA